jgi:hypothetical protein
MKVAMMCGGLLLWARKKVTQSRIVSVEMREQGGEVGGHSNKAH